MAKKSLLVVGGGAAGFFCAVNAARLNRDLEVTILEKSNKLLSKVQVSGGGRCNVTHACFDIAAMIEKYPRGKHFLRKAFHQFFTVDTIAWFESRGVKLKAEADGRMFPVTDSSQTIINCLQQEAAKYGVKVITGTAVTGIRRAGEQFIIDTAGGPQRTADAICLACGGYPKSAMFGWVEPLGHQIEPPVPSLFTFNMPGNAITSLMGVSVPLARVRIMGTRLQEEGPLLITHWGLSGPVILRLSAWGARLLAGGIDGRPPYEFRIQVQWVPESNENELRSQLADWRKEFGPRMILNKNPLHLPQRLWSYWMQQAGITEETRWADLTVVAQNKLVQLLTAQEFLIKGKTTFKEEFVTAGGVTLKDIDPATMGSRIVPGLYFAGEVMDVDGITGGFNFQHAWTSGYIAATAIAKATSKDLHGADATA